MRVVIPGGSGLVGRRLVERLAQEGHESVVLSRRPERVADLPAGSRAEIWDSRSVDTLTPLIEGADAVVHLIGENVASGRWTAAKKRRIRESRVESSRAVAGAFARASDRPDVLVQASAVGYYGPRGDEEITEDSSPGQDYLAEICQEWETASAEVEKLGVRRAIVRTGIVLSTAGGALPRMVLPFRLWVGGPVGSGNQWFPWIHLADEVGAIEFVLERKDATGPFNLTSPQPVTNRDFGRALGRVLRRPSALPVPGFALRLAFGEMGEMLLTGQRAIPKRLLRLGYSFEFPDVEDALHDLLG